MSKTTLFLFSSIVALFAPSPSRACGFSAEEMQTIQANRAVAVANHCENDIVTPGGSIGSIYVGEAVEDAAKAPNAADIAFEIAGGKVVRVKRTAPVACVSTGFAAPLRVVTATSEVPNLAGLTIARDASGVRAEVRSL
jgi:hypothetical protein